LGKRFHQFATGRNGCSEHAIAAAAHELCELATGHRKNCGHLNRPGIWLSVKSTVYIETTVPSYLTAWRSPELVMAANQEATRKWWDESRVTFDLFVSELVIGEMSVGDPDAVKRRLDAVENIPELALTNKAEELAAKLLEGAALPQKAKADALHIAIATVHGMDYLLTWNCTHIANAIMRPRIESICRSAGYEPPVICTPPELVEEQ
jgi:predicted nucleic acid-binding protein